MIIFKTLDLFKAYGDINNSRSDGKEILPAMLTQLLRVILSVVFLGVTARIFPLAAFGYLASTSVVINAMNIIREIGLNLVIIEEENLSRSTFDRLFWVNLKYYIYVLIVGTIIFLFYKYFLGFGFIIIRFYFVAIILFLLNGITLIYESAIQRSGKIGFLNALALVEQLVSFVSMFLLWRFFHIQEGLIIGPLLGRIFYGFFIFLKVRHVPRLSWRNSLLKSERIKTGHIGLFSIATYISRNLDTFLISLNYPIDLLAGYSKMYDIHMVPLRVFRGPINTWSISVFNRKRGNGSFHELVIEVFRGLCLLSGVLFILFYVGYDWITYLILGEKWMEYSMILRYLGAMAAVQLSLGIRGSYLLGTGSSKRYMNGGMIASILTTIVILANVQFGVEALASRLLQLQMVLFPLLIIHCFITDPILLQKICYIIFQTVLSLVILILFYYEFVKSLNSIVAALMLIVLFTISELYRGSYYKSLKRLF